MSKFTRGDITFDKNARIEYCSLKDIFGDFEAFLDRTEMPEPLHNTPEVIERMGAAWLAHFKSLPALQAKRRTPKSVRLLW